jgi:hypothetical protein
MIRTCGVLGLALATSCTCCSASNAFQPERRLFAAKPSALGPSRPPIVSSGSAQPGCGVPLPDRLRPLRERRDLDPSAHRAAYTELMRMAELPWPGTEDLLYEHHWNPRTWLPYPDTWEALENMEHRGLPVAVPSNIPRDLRPVFRYHRLDPLISGYVFSYAEGMQKPDAEIFRRDRNWLPVPPRPSPPGRPAPGRAPQRHRPIWPVTEERHDLVTKMPQEFPIMDSPPLVGGHQWTRGSSMISKKNFLMVATGAMLAAGIAIGVTGVAAGTAHAQGTSSFTIVGMGETAQNVATVEVSFTCSASSAPSYESFTATAIQGVTDTGSTGLITCTGSAQTEAIDVGNANTLGTGQVQVGVTASFEDRSSYPSSSYPITLSGATATVSYTAAPTSTGA